MIIELLITLNIQELRLNNVIEQSNMYICTILHSCVKVFIVIQQCLFEKMCYTTMSKKFSK